MTRLLSLAMLACVCLADIPPPPPPPVKGAPAVLQQTGAADGRVCAAAAGALLSLAVVLAGVVLVRRKRSSVLPMVALVLAGAGAAACFADVPPPPPRGAPTTLVIHSEEASAFSLRIPADLLTKSSGVVPTDSPLRSAVGGALFSLAFVLAGMLLVRSKRRAVLAVGVLALAGTGAIVAQLPHPSNLDPGSLTELRRVMDTSKDLSGKVAVQIVPTGEPLTLIVPGPRQPRLRPH